MIFSSTNFLLRVISNKLDNIWISGGISDFQDDIFSEDSKSNKSEKSPNEEPEKEFDWALKIPKINLYAEIADGTDEDVLNSYIGHFNESKKESGNVCLAAHNRGYDVNYFSGLKNLKVGDKIYYYINGNTYKYKVSEILVVYETDLSVIENTEEDMITLITCIENREAYRLCVQGIKVE